MPVGIAGTAALLIGIGFSFLGMCQTWVGLPSDFSLLLFLGWVVVVG